MKLTVQTVVKNEDRWVYFALQSVLPFVEKILVFDTGSTDKTVEAIKSTNSSKIIFEEKGLVDGEGLVKLRREQLEMTKTEWFLLLDGDEIWPRQQLRKLLEEAEKSPPDTLAIFNRVKNCIGDVYHLLPESAGRYKISDIKGNLNTRLIKKIPGLQISGSYPLEYYFDGNGPIQDQTGKMVFADVWYLHASFLKRSTSAAGKVSGSFGRSRIWQKGLNLSADELPEVFFLPRPPFVPDPLEKRSRFYEAGAIFTSPLIELKRKLK